MRKYRSKNHPNAAEPSQNHPQNISNTSRSLPNVYIFYCLRFYLWKSRERLYGLLYILWKTKVYDLSEAEDPNLISAFLADKKVESLRTEAGVNLISHETLSSVSKYKIW